MGNQFKGITCDELHQYTFSENNFDLVCSVYFLVQNYIMKISPKNLVPLVEMVIFKASKWLTFLPAGWTTTMHWLILDMLQTHQAKIFTICL